MFLSSSVEFGLSRDFLVDFFEYCFADSALGLISRQVGILVKFGSWSFSVTNASLLAMLSALSSIPSFVAMFLFPEWMAFVLVDRCMLTVLVCKSSLFC